MHLKALEPWRKAGEHCRTWLSHPDNPFAQQSWARGLGGSLEIFERWTRIPEKPSWDTLHVTYQGKQYHAHAQVVISKSFCQLKHFTLSSGQKDMSRPKLLIVAPLSGHYATLLRDTVSTLLIDHDVYITDWINARDVPLSAGSFDCDDYIDDLWDFIRHIGERLHLLAVCQPAVQVLALASLMAQHHDALRPLTITLMGGPLDTRINPTRVNTFAQEHTLAWFEQSTLHYVPVGYQGVGRLVYPGFLQLTGFLMLNQQRHFEAHVKFLEDLSQDHQDKASAHRKFYDEYLSVMDMTAEYFTQTIRDVFHEHRLPLGQLEWRGQRVDPSIIRDTALLTIEGEHDDISGLGQTYAAHAMCSALPESMKQHHAQKNVGHYGLFSGHRWREEIAPRIRDFIQHHKEN